MKRTLDLDFTSWLDDWNGDDPLLGNISDSSISDNGVSDGDAAMQGNAPKQTTTTTASSVASIASTATSSTASNQSAGGFSQDSDDGGNRPPHKRPMPDRSHDSHHRTHGKASPTLTATTHEDSTNSDISSVGTGGSSSGRPSSCFFLRSPASPVPFSRHQQQQLQQPQVGSSNATNAFTNLPDNSSILGHQATDNQRNYYPHRTTNTPELAQIATQLNQLSVDERSRVYEEVHGVAPPIQETPQLIQTSITKMINRIKKMKSHQRTAYEKASFLNPKYIKSQDFQLLFLRAEQFQPTKAAFRMIEYFDTKLDLFGPDLLAKRIVFDDLDVASQQSVLRTEGACMYSTMRDSVGRAYFLHRYVHEVVRESGDDNTQANNNKTLIPAKRHAKALWYMVMACISDDVPTQQKGANLLACTIGTTPSDFMTMLNVQTYTSSVVKSLPIRFSACHVCVEAATVGPLVPLLTKFFPDNVRVRTKIHYGSNIECGYSLQTFGIDRSVLPLDDDGKLRADHIQTWINQLQQQEQQRQEAEQHDWPSNAIALPRETDILMGRGMSKQSHPGTVQMMQYLQSRSTEYFEAITRTQKNEFANQILNEFQTKGIRFLDFSGEYWMETDHAKAHEKVCMSFRNIKRK